MKLNKFYLLHNQLIKLIDIQSSNVIDRSEDYLQTTLSIEETILSLKEVINGDFDYKLAKEIFGCTS